MDLGIKGKKALVCASSKGLGMGCARALAAAGVDLVMNAPCVDALEAAAAAIRADFGVAVETVSRSFSRLEQLGILQVSGKAVHIQDSTQLLLMANAQCA